MKTSVIVFAKAPVAGLAKTRLAPALGAEGAAALAARLLRHALAQATGAGLGPVELCGAPDATHPALREAASACGATLAAQGDGDLGERMHRAIARHVAAGRRALLMGSDAPALQAATLRAAAAALDDHDAVFVPALDGGYVLVGLARAEPRLFLGLRWSHPGVMADARERLRAAGLRWRELPALPDIDEPADLVHLPPGWLPPAAGGSGAPVRQGASG